MKGGANTFPFHNLLPYSESNEGLFLFFSPSLNWIKEKSVATLAIRIFAIQKPTKSVHRITCIYSEEMNNLYSLSTWFSQQLVSSYHHFVSRILSCGNPYPFPQQNPL